ncbi:MAG: hypothetical protein H7X93_09580 [Sphingomonadaceae bacterium]|nr:hypothetical protein [Sphingomonadaceae bacterium]
MAQRDTIEQAVLECLGDAWVEAVRSSMTLPATPQRFEALPPRVLLLLFASRSGSTYAGRLLAQTPYFNKVRGAFHPPRLARMRERLGLADDAAAAHATVAADATERAFGAKCGSAGLVAALHTGFLDDAFDRLSFVMLRRRDPLAQAISLVKASLTGRFFSRQHAATRLTADDYDRRAIEQQLALVGEINDGLERFAQRLGKAVSVHYYEEICSDPAGFVNAVCGGLDLPQVDRVSVDVGLEVLRDDVSRQWRERYEAGQ